MATGRRGRKTTTKRKRASATKRRKRGRTAAARTKRKKVKTRPKKAKAKTRKATRARPRARARVAKAKRPTRAPKPPAPPLVEAEIVEVAAAAPAPVPGGDGLQRRIEQTLRDHDYDPPDSTVVAVLTAIGTGYGLGPAHPPAWLRVDTAGPIAEGVVERFAIGDRADDIDRRTHRGTVRATVDFNLDQLPGDPTGEAERAVIASFCLGSWEPGMDENAERNGIASFVVPWYLAGRG